MDGWMNMLLLTVCEFTFAHAPSQRIEIAMPQHDAANNNSAQLPEHAFLSKSILQICLRQPKPQNLPCVCTSFCWCCHTMPHTKNGVKVKPSFGTTYAPTALGPKA